MQLSGATSMLLKKLSWAFASKRKIEPSELERVPESARPSIAAGLVGFRKPEGADDKAYEKLVQKPYDDGWIAFQNIGNHVGCMSQPFAESLIAPMLIEDEVNAGHGKGK